MKPPYTGLFILYIISFSLLFILMFVLGCGTKRGPQGVQGDRGDVYEDDSRIITICKGTDKERHLLYSEEEWLGVDKHGLKRFEADGCYRFRGCNFCIDEDGGIHEG